MLWVPDTFIVDSKKSFLHDITVENRLIRIYPNGTVLYAIRITTTVACSMDLTKYPMDKQTCTLQLESWGYNINDVMFYWTRGNDSVRGLDTLQLAQYTVEDHFTSVSEAVYETGKNSLVTPSRKFEFSDSIFVKHFCEGVTTVLTMTTLMMGARTSLPNANCFIKAIDVYLGICFSFIFGALLEYAVAHFCTLHRPNSKEIPKICWYLQYPKLEQDLRTFMDVCLQLKLQLMSNPASSESVAENAQTSKGEDFIHELHGSEPFLIKETKPTRTPDGLYSILQRVVLLQ
ncbi:UNVERIFIED_CONTAM: hypothetical protein H355_016528 [Colinus virginianus]|nr:hypothetical protein H355_016528 [Colinus virginianus]